MGFRSIGINDSDLIALGLCALVMWALEGRAPNLARDLKGFTVVGALKRGGTAGGDPSHGGAVLLLEPPELLNELVLREFQIQLLLDLVIERTRIVLIGSVRRSPLRDELPETLEDRDLIFIGEETLEQSPGIVEARCDQSVGRERIDIRERALLVVR